MLSHNRIGRVGGSSTYSLLNVAMYHVSIIMMNWPHGERTVFKTSENVVLVSYRHCNKLPQTLVAETIANSLFYNYAARRVTGLKSKYGGLTD